MKHTVRKLFREIHRRSVWQVLGVYVAVSFAAFSAVGALTTAVGLPDWTLTLALGLLLLGLPLIAATAFIQEGIPGLRIEDEVDPNLLVGRTPAEVHVVPQDHPMHGVGTFTWENAVVCAVAGTVVLVGSVVAYLAMWTLGIPPVGSLVAQGLLSPRDPVVLADFKNETDDAALGVAVTHAFRVGLAESEIVTVVDAPVIATSLGEMGRDRNEILTPELAHQIATRHGFKAVVEGSISRSGPGYVVEAALVLPGEDAAVVRFTERAPLADDIVPVIYRLTARLRERIGESLKVIRGGEPLGDLTTPSLDALKSYAQGMRELDMGETERAMELFGGSCSDRPIIYDGLALARGAGWFGPLGHLCTSRARRAQGSHPTPRSGPGS